MNRMNVALDRYLRMPSYGPPGAADTFRAAATPTVCRSPDATITPVIWLLRVFRMLACSQPNRVLLSQASSSEEESSDEEEAPPPAVVVKAKKVLFNDALDPDARGFPSSDGPPDRQPSDG